MSKKHKHNHNPPPPSPPPIQDGNHQSGNSRHVYAHPPVEIDLFEDFKREYRQNQRETTNLSRKNLRLGIISAFLVLVYATLTLLIYCANNKAAKAAKEAADTAAKQLELEERPWIDANITLNGPLTFDVNGASIPLKIALRNSGHSPAMFTVISPLPLTGFKGVDAANHVQEVCQNAARISTTMPQFGITLFPNTTFDSPESIGLGKEAMDAATKEPVGSHFHDKIMSPSVIVCMAYQPSFKPNTVYHTAYIVDLWKRDSHNLPTPIFKIGENVDQQRLFLQMHVMRAVTAD